MRQFKKIDSFTDRSRWYSKSTPLLTIDEEVDLCCRAKTDRSARDKLVIHNIRFVVSVAKRYRNQGLDFDDLVSEGVFGLMRATQEFDETRGFRFISYAVWWIRQSILAALERDGDLLKYPWNHRIQMRDYMKLRESLEQELGREITVDDLSEVMEDADEVMQRNQKIKSTDEPYDDVISFGDTLSNPPQEESDIKHDINQALKKLKPDQRTV